MDCYYHPSIQASATCVSCGKAICQSCAVDISGRINCQSCVSTGRVSQPTKPTNQLAVASVVLGVLSLCLGGLIFSIPAWILGNMAQKQLEENPNQEGTQLAKIGKTIGMIVTILVGSLLALYIFFVVGALIVSLIGSAIQQ